MLRSESMNLYNMVFPKDEAQNILLQITENCKIQFQERKPTSCFPFEKESLLLEEILQTVEEVSSNIREITDIDLNESITEAQSKLMFDSLKTNLMNSPVTSFIQDKKQIVEKWNNSTLKDITAIKTLKENINQQINQFSLLQSINYHFNIQNKFYSENESSSLLRNSIRGRDCLNIVYNY